MKLDERTTLYVDFRHIESTDQSLADAITAEYHYLEDELRSAVRNIMRKRYPEYATEEKEFFVNFYNTSALLRVRDMKSDRVGKLTSFSGTVTRTSEVRPELVTGIFECELCGATSDPVRAARTGDRRPRSAARRRPPRPRPLGRCRSSSSTASRKSAATRRARTRPAGGSSTPSASPSLWIGSACACRRMRPRRVIATAHSLAPSPPPAPPPPPSFRAASPAPSPPHLRPRPYRSQIPAGSMPRTIDVILRGDTVERAKAGDKSIFTGTLVAVPDVAQLCAPGERLEMVSKVDARNPTDGARHPPRGCLPPHREPAWGREPERLGGRARSRATLCGRSPRALPTPRMLRDGRGLARTPPAQRPNNFRSDTPRLRGSEGPSQGHPPSPPRGPRRPPRLLGWPRHVPSARGRRGHTHRARPWPLPLPAPSLPLVGGHSGSALPAVAGSLSALDSPPPPPADGRRVGAHQAARLPRAHLPARLPRLVGAARRAAVGLRQHPRRLGGGDPQLLLGPGQGHDRGDADHGGHLREAGQGDRADHLRPRGDQEGHPAHAPRRGAQGGQEGGRRRRHQAARRHQLLPRRRPVDRKVQLPQVRLLHPAASRLLVGQGLDRRRPHRHRLQGRGDGRVLHRGRRAHARRQRHLLHRRV